MADEVKRNTLYNVLTRIGHDFIEKRSKSKKLEISRVVIGDGKLPTGIEYARERTSVISPKLNLDIVGCKINDAGMAIIECWFTNANIDKKFPLRELGVYVKVPKISQEILYAYRNYGIYSEDIPACDSGKIIGHIYTVPIAVGWQIENVKAEFKQCC